MPPIPITIVNGFLGSGKTTLILGLLPQLPKDYRVALLKNEFGDVTVDTQLASQSSISGVKELLNGCICCNLVGQLGDALEDLRKNVDPDRIIIETSGSAFPATLAMEVNRLGRARGEYMLDGVIVVIDVENWQGYEDTSYTAKIQARFTDLIVFNKWELAHDRRYQDCLDRVGDLELQSATVRSDRGRVESSILLGLDSALAKANPHPDEEPEESEPQDQDKSHHQNEVEVLSVSLFGDAMMDSINLESLETFLLSAAKDEVYRIKGIIRASRPPASSNGDIDPAIILHGQKSAEYILNWAFGRWSFTPLTAATRLPSPNSSQASQSLPTALVEGVEMSQLARITVILARGEATKWKRRIETQGHIEPEKDAAKGNLRVQRIL